MMNVRWLVNTLLSFLYFFRTIIVIFDCVDFKLYLKEVSTKLIHIYGSEAFRIATFTFKFGFGLTFSGSSRTRA